MRAGFNLYRAIPQDAKANAAQLATGFRLQMPVLAIGGGNSYPHARGRGKECEQSMRNVAINVRGAVIDECGHFVPEEQPEVFNRLLMEFFVEAHG
jgi:pimeloyl-ACP methyl ester carboxylesterase